MSSAYNRTSSYNRTYEKRVIEEVPRVRIGSPLQLSGVNSPLHVSTSFQPTLSSMSPANGLGFITSHQQSDDYLSVQLDVSQFKPDELKVSVVGQFVVVDAKHAEREDNFGFVERHFIRKFRLPPSVPADAVTSNLTADGQLSVTASAPRFKDDGSVRTIPIKIVPTSVKTECPADGKPHSSQSTEQQQ